MKRSFFQRKVDALTLTELLVVMVIIGILTLVALPNFMGGVVNAYKVEAQQNLKHIQSQQEIYRLKNSKYATDLEVLGYKAPLTESEGGTGVFAYSISSATATSFTAKAEALRDFDGNGQVLVMEINQQGKITELIPD